MGLEERLKLNSRGVAINGGLVKSPRNTAPYILANIPKLLPSSSLHTTITGTSFSFVFSAFDGNFFLLLHPSSNLNSKSGLDDAILDQN